MYGWTLHKYIHFHMDELQIGPKHTTYICRRKKVLENHFFTSSLLIEFDFSWFSVHPVGYGWKPSVQGKCSAAATRRPSTSVFVFFRLSFRAFVAMIPHSISHPFLGLKSLTIPHLLKSKNLKLTIIRKPHLCGSFTEFNCFFPSFSIEYSLLLQVLRRSSQESSLCEISCDDDDDDDDDDGKY